MEIGNSCQEKINGLIISFKIDIFNSVIIKVPHTLALKIHRETRDYVNSSTFPINYNTNLIR